MQHLLRRVRAAAFFSAIFASAWGTFGALLAMSRVVGRIDLRQWVTDPSLYIGRSALTWTMLGAIAGVVFAAGTALTERGKSLLTLSRWRVVALGALAGSAGVLVGAVEQRVGTGRLRDLSGLVLNVPVCATLGALSALLVVRLARRGPRAMNRTAAMSQLEMDSRPLRNVSQSVAEHRAL